MSLFNRTTVVSAAAAVLIGCSTLVAEVMPKIEPTTDLAATPGGAYKVDASHTSVTFEIMHMNFSTYVGRFNTVDASLNFNKAAPEKSTATVTIDTASIDTNNDVLEGKLRSAEFFDAVKHPKITFVADKLDLKTASTGTLSGQLTMHGVTKPLTLDVTFNGGAKNPMTQNYTLGFAATGVLKRSDYGITAYIPLVGDEVKITVHSEFYQ